MKKDPQDELEMQNEEIQEDEVQTETTEFEEKIKKAEAEALEFKNRYLRALADYKNLEHRMNQERDRMKSALTKQYVTRFLPVLDHMEQAEAFMKDTGLQMVISSFKQALKEMGVTEIELLGEEFDPYKAEVIEVVPGEKDNIVVEVLEKAYSLSGEIVRHGRVKVSKASK